MAYPSDYFSFYNAAFYSATGSLAEKYPSAPSGSGLTSIPLAVCWGGLTLAEQVADALADVATQGTAWPLILNIEPIIVPSTYQDVTDPTTIANTAAYLDDVLDLVFQVRKDYPGILLGMYGQPQRQRIRVHQDIRSRIQILNDAMSISCPSLYAGINSTQEEWLASCYQVLPPYEKFGKQIFPFINPSEMPGTTDQVHLTEAMWHYMCATVSNASLFPYLAGAIVWGGWWFNGASFSRRTLAAFGNTYIGIAKSYHRGKLYTF